jgi:hypothetical protein
VKAVAVDVYNKTSSPVPNSWTSLSRLCITKPMSAGGRPTDDPKGTLVAVRLSARQVLALQRRARQEDTGLSEAIRRCLDEWAAAPAAQKRSSPPRPSRRTKKEPIKQPAAPSRARSMPRRKRRITK